MNRASSSRPTLTSHLGDSGNHHTMTNRITSGMIWKAIGNLQRIGEAPLSTNERPLSSVRSCKGKKKWEGEGGNAQLEPVRYHDSEDVERELNSNELTSTSVRNTFCSPHWYNGIQDTSAPTIGQSCYVSISFDVPSFSGDFTKDHPNMILSRTLQTSSQYTPSCTKSNSLDPPNFFSYPTSNKSTYQSTQVIH